MSELLFRSPQLSQQALYGLRIDSEQRFKPTAGYNPSYPGHRELHVFRGVIRNAFLKSDELHLNIGLLLLGDSILQGIDKSGLPQTYFRLQLGCQLFTQPLIGKAFLGTSLTEMIEILNRVRLVAARSTLENRCHRIVSFTTSLSRD
jgi:hypothetical protein